MLAKRRSLKRSRNTKAAGIKHKFARNWPFTTPSFINVKKYAGINSQELKRLKELDEENRRLKHMYAELEMTGDG